MENENRKMNVVVNENWTEKTGFSEHSGGSGAIWVAQNMDDGTTQAFSTFLKAKEYVERKWEGDEVLVIPVNVDVPEILDNEVQN